jgi:hypothetical protein
MMPNVLGVSRRASQRAAAPRGLALMSNPKRALEERRQQTKDG